MCCILFQYTLFIWEHRGQKTHNKGGSEKISVLTWCSDRWVQGNTGFEPSSPSNLILFPHVRENTFIKNRNKAKCAQKGEIHETIKDCALEYGCKMNMQPVKNRGQKYTAYRNRTWEENLKTQFQNKLNMDALNLTSVWIPTVKESDQFLHYL